MLTLTKRSAGSTLSASYASLWVFLAVALPAIAALASPMSTIDLAYQVRVGELTLDTRSLVTVDPLTFSAAGEPWTNQQWLAELAFAWLFRAGSWPLLAVAHAVLVGITFALVLGACRARGASPRAAAWLTLGAFLVAAPALALRPQLLGLVLFSLTVRLLSAVDKRAWAVVPLVAVAWANVHGSFVLAPVLVALAWLSDRSERRLVVVAIATAVATLLNPFGAGAWAYAAGLTSNPAITTFVTEWQRTNPLSATGAVFYLSVVAAIVIASLRRHEMMPSGWVGLVAFAAIGAYAERGVAWWALAAAWLLARPLGAIVGHERRNPRSRANSAIAGSVVLAGIALLPWPYRGTSAGPLPLLVDAPTGIAGAVHSIAGSSDRLFAAQSWASWLELEAPGVPVLVDSRVEVAPPDAWSDYITVTNATPGWEYALDRRGVTVVAVSAVDQPALLRAIGTDARWRRIHADSDGAVFVRA